MGGVPLGLLVQFAPLSFTGRGKGEGEGEGEGKGAVPPPLVQFGLLPWGPPPLVGCLASLLWPMWSISSPGGSGNPPDTPITTRYIPEHFPCPNTIILYINLYQSSISRLPVMSMISSETPNNIHSPNHITHIILNRHRTLSVRTLLVRELCRHDRDTSLRSITNSGT